MAKILIQNLSTREFIVSGSKVKRSNLPQSVDEAVANKLAKLYPAEVKIIDTAKGGAKPSSAKSAPAAAPDADSKSFEDAAK